MSGDPVDMQREKRWPGQTDNAAPGVRGVRVRFDENGDDSDLSDTEGVLGGVAYNPKTGVLRAAIEEIPAAEEMKSEL